MQIRYRQRSIFRLLALFIIIICTLPYFSHIPSTPDHLLAAQGNGFGFGGTVNLDEMSSRAVARQSDGKIVVSGTMTDSEGSHIVVRRFLSDGRRDISFGSGGLVVTNISDGDQAEAMIIQPNGRILVAGRTRVSDSGGDQFDFLVLGLRSSDGQLDSTFANNGVLQFDVGSGEYEGAKDIANHEANGAQGFVVVGAAEIGGDDDFIVARFSSNGDPDNSFSNDGIVTIGFGDGDDGAEAVTIQPDGKIVVVGYADDTFISADRDFGVARLFSNGILDNSFSGDGRAKIGFGETFEVAHAVTVQPNGRILIAGDIFSGAATFTELALVRLLPNGTKDNSFGANDGELIISATSEFHRAVELMLLADGRFMLAGSAGYNFLLMRFLEDGRLDKPYGQGGKVLGPEGLTYDALRDPDGKILLTGQNLLARYREDGSLDGDILPGMPDQLFGGFSGAGLAVNDDLSVNGVARQADGKILAAGSTDPGFNSGDFALRRFMPDGRIDTSFGVNGLAVVDLDFGAAEAVAVNANGLIVATGNGSSGSGRNFITAGFNANGVEIFRHELDPGGVNSNQGAYDVAFQNDGKIVLVGNTVIGDNSDFVVARYLANGQLDSSFGQNAGYTISGLGGHEHALAMALQPDGKIVAVGPRQESSLFGGLDTDFVVARWLSSGLLDNSFHGDGKRVIEFDNESEQANDVAVDPASGKIVVVGRSGERIAIARLHSNGDLDSSFDGDGMLTKNNFGTALAVDLQRGQIVIAYGQSQSMGLMWFNSDGSFGDVFGFLGLQIVGAGFDMLREPSGQYIVGSGQTVARLQTNSQLDKSGATLYDIAPEDNRAFGLAVQEDGKIVVAGQMNTAGPGQDADFAATRYLPDGRLDQSFAANGLYTFGFAADDIFLDVDVLPDQKIILAGSSVGGTQGSNFAAMRLTPAGVDDKTLLVDFHGQDDFGQKVLAQPDGGFVIVGMATNGAEREIALARFNAEAKLDQNYGTGGKVTTRIGAGFVSARGAALMPDGRLIVVGGHAGDYLILRYLVNGSLDPTFGSGGIVKLNKLGNDEARGVGLLNNGLIAVTGYMAGDFGLLLLNQNGTICSSDCEFATSEPYLLTDFGDDEGPYDLLVQPDGRFIVVGGKRGLDPDDSEFLIARYRFNNFPNRGYGLDTSFGSGGIVRSQTLNSDVARAAALDNFGHLLVAGYGFNGRDNDFLLASYHTQKTIVIAGPTVYTTQFPLVIGAR